MKKYLVGGTIVFALMVSAALAGNGPEQSLKTAGCHGVAQASCHGTQESGGCHGEKATASCHGRVTLLQKMAARQEQRQSNRVERSEDRAARKAAKASCHGTKSSCHGEVSNVAATGSDCP